MIVFTHEEEMLVSALESRKDIISEQSSKKSCPKLGRDKIITVQPSTEVKDREVTKQGHFLIEQLATFVERKLQRKRKFLLRHSS